MKKLLSVLLAVMMLLSAVPVMAEEVVIEAAEEAIVAPIILEEEEEEEEEPAHVCAADVKSEAAEGVHFSCTEGFVETVKPTCTEKGYDVYTCHEEACGKTFTTNYVDATGHDFVMNEDTNTPAAKVTKEATCTEAGTIEYTCKVCGTVTEEIPALDHVWGEETVVEVTCTTEGYKEHTCTKCGAYEKYDVVKELGHKAGEELFYDCEGALCDAKGKLVEFYICQNPGCLEKVVVTEVSEYWAEMDHQAELDKLVEVELTAEMTDAEKAEAIRAMAADVYAASYVGADGKNYINVAPNGMQIPGAPTGCYGWFHDAEVDYEPATCTENGHLVLTCVSDKCATKANVSVVLPKLGHDYVTDEEKLGKENKPTCLENGAVLVHCTRCDFEEQVEIVAPGFHNLEDGYSLFSQTTLNGTVENVTEEEFEEKIATCVDYTEVQYCGGHKKVVITLSNGDKVNYKINCKYHTEEIAHAGDGEHDADPDSFAVKQPTCTEYGFKMSYCMDCGETTKVVLDPLNHPTRKTEIIEKPTCTEDGVKHEICELCGDVVKVAIPATRHAWENEEYAELCPVKVVEATCTTDGSITTTCYFCGEKKVETIKAGHTAPSDDEIMNGEGNQAYTAPTCTTEGERSYRCTVCHEYIVGEKIAALGHEWEREGVEYVRDFYCEENGEYYEWYRYATCQRTARYGRFCDDCEHKDYQYVGTKLGHLLCAYDEVKGEVVTTNLIIDTNNLPTCEKTGKAFFNCVICDEYCEIELPKLPHNPTVKFNATERKYEIVCDANGITVADATAEGGLMADYLWNEIEACTDTRSAECIERAETVFAAAQGDLFVKLTDSKGNVRGLGCGTVLEEIKMNKTEYNVAMDGNKVTITAKDNVALLDEAYVLVSWAYTLSDGTSFTFSNTFFGKANDEATEWNFTVRAGKLQNATLESITVVVTDDVEAESVRAENAKGYGILQEKY